MKIYILDRQTSMGMKWFRCLSCTQGHQLVSDPKLANVVFVCTDTVGARKLKRKTDDDGYTDVYLLDTVKKLVSSLGERSNVLVMIMSPILPKTLPTLIDLCLGNVYLGYAPLFQSEGDFSGESVSDCNFFAVGIDDDVKLVKPILELYHSFSKKNTRIGVMSLRSAVMLRVLWSLKRVWGTAFRNYAIKACLEEGALSHLVLKSLCMCDNCDLGIQLSHDPTDLGIVDSLSKAAIESNTPSSPYVQAMILDDEFVTYCASYLDTIQSKHNLGIFILGKSVSCTSKSYETSFSTKVHSSLVKNGNLIVAMIDDWVDGSTTVIHMPGIFFIGCAREEYSMIQFPVGSIVVDPFGIVPSRVGITVHNFMGTPV